MLRPILLTAVLTGVFCAGFAVGIDFLTDMLERGSLIGISFLSGFLGSIFAQTVLGRWRESRNSITEE
jgi:hypothetical protein